MCSDEDTMNHRAPGHYKAIILIAHSGFSMAAQVMSRRTACPRAMKSASLFKELSYFTHPILKVSGMRLA